jgi:hypothetical protein
MSAKPPNVYSFFPRSDDNIDIFYWCNMILGLDVKVANMCFLTWIDHCKADKPLKHEKA